MKFEQATRFALLSALIAMGISYPVAAKVTNDGAIWQLLPELIGAMVGLGTSFFVFRYLQQRTKLSHGQLCLLCFLIQATCILVSATLLR